VRTISATRYLTRGAKEGRPGLVTLGSLLVLSAIYRRLLRSEPKRVLRRRLKPGQGLMVRVAAPGEKPFSKLRRVR
jgi:hypothetical protein